MVKLWLGLYGSTRFNDFFETVERLPDIKLTGYRQQLGESHFITRARPLQDGSGDNLLMINCLIIPLAWRYFSSDSLTPTFMAG
jgi:hypothetical protein